VFAAASLTTAFKEVGGAFERANPGTRVRFSFAASADREQMAPLARTGKVGSVAPFVSNRLVVVTPRNHPGRVRRLQDLARPALRLVLTAEQVPIGRYTRLALAKMSADVAFGKDFRQRVLANVISQEANVRALLARVELGEADAAVVYASDAAASRRVQTVPIPARYNVEAVYPIGVVTAASRPREAAAFVRFVRSPAARRVMKRHGFQPH
jgi:molybdate transport system substrate-binding protein